MHGQLNLTFLFSVLKKVAVIDNVSSTLLEAPSQICFPVSCRLYTFVGWIQWKDLPRAGMHTTLRSACWGQYCAGSSWASQERECLLPQQCLWRRLSLSGMPPLSYNILHNTPFPHCWLLAACCLLPAGCKPNRPGELGDSHPLCQRITFS